MAEARDTQDARNDRRGRSAQAPRQRARRADAARTAAWHLLAAVDEGAYANLELPHVLRRFRLAGRDAAFATELALGTVRQQGLYDLVIARATGRAVDTLDPELMRTLRLGAHQALSMRVPPHAAADQTVALARWVNGAGPAKLVNAAMHRMTEKDRETWVAEVTEGLQGPDLLAARHSHPTWVVRALMAGLVDRGRPVEEIDELLAAHNSPALVSLVARPGWVEVSELLEHPAVEEGRWAPTAATLSEGAPAAVAAVEQGRAGVQDEGSQLAALALAGAPTRGQDTGLWLDLCAGPGGKAALLAATAHERGARIVANELHPHRAELVRGTLAPGDLPDGAAPQAEVTVGDGADLAAERPDAFDRVLVDVPCTGLGALRRRPEARWRRQPADLASLAPTQRSLLHAALDAVRPGGVVAYVTCSPHPAETSVVVDDVRARRDDVELLEVAPVLREVAPATSAADLEPVDGARGARATSVQLWPHVHGTDAMYIALLRRTPQEDT
ncbi:RsmB/NOP family class I SAM-dependent RNA methyltransferase [Kytococcus sedentarius]|uniref:RsmB/NOP family class I SAM-dependent RNA methyltransferase n=1 Tax=Kytococcus sedentarius TaxID=1276 RepID=UPI00195282BD|nr:RsmB/NOP family class I SAM-dependent RNA methyltransferase [Kytococcus sedentarius]QRO88287.1 RsmB/NOP family class I SAM-dependent RNA methyltransferase [Kytococcus sedentarius]